LADVRILDEQVIVKLRCGAAQTIVFIFKSLVFWGSKY